VRAFVTVFAFLLCVFGDPLIGSAVDIILRTPFFGKGVFKEMYEKVEKSIDFVSNLFIKTIPQGLGPSIFNFLEESF
jgi:hypothetical protein